MRIEEITVRQNQLRKNITENESILNQLRIERGQLSIADAKKNTEAIRRLDKQIDTRRRNLENFPIELSLLEEQLTKEKQLEAQKQKVALLKQQQKVVDDVEQLSDDFVNTLTRAMELNTDLRSAITAETRLREKTGQVLLSQYCHGSQQSLRMLLEMSQHQMQGQHTIPAEQLGMIANTTPIRL